MSIPAITEIQDLQGKQLALLDSSQRSVLDFYLQQGRKFDVAIELKSDADKGQLETASPSQAMQIMERANTHIGVAVGLRAQEYWSARAT